ncbi:sulfotransferase domain-containing protein [Patescibacteria group bacterium]|nr:sulfotransferase domain-containing protein [Patescibacteria group bacterium]
MNKYIICSGLRRSGTSMLMYCLRQGGVPILGQKYAVHINFNTPISEKEKYGNPNGYWEMGSITTLTGIKENHADLGMNGDVIKVVTDVLYHSDPDTIEKVIFMKRSPRAVMASLMKAGQITNQDQIAAYTEKFIIDTRKSIKFLNDNNKPFISISYEEILENPEQELRKVHDFLDKGTPQPQLIEKKLNRTSPIIGDISRMGELEELLEEI